MANWMVGIDIGGTFTDIAAAEADAGDLLIAKVPSTPGDPSHSVIEGLRRLEEVRPGFRVGDIRFFAHGTTVATNALLELKGARVGLLITRGFGATYEFHGGLRPSGPDLADTFYQKPPVLVPGRFTEEIDERTGFDGAELGPLDEDGVRRAARRLRDAGVDSIAVVYLFSFMDPRHEERTAEIVREEHPSCRISLSHTVLPAIREYLRLSTTVLDAYVGPIMETYLRRLTDRLREASLTTEQVFLMQSNGGLMRIDVAARYPNQTLLSGPAAGSIFGANIAALSGQDRIVTFDMGGTSTDITVLTDGHFEETRAGRINGQDIGTPMIEIRTIGAGGGTIAWVGPDGLLKAGPQSAGADPGPACYGHGGVEATVTDADVVLGYLNPHALAGGRVPIDARLAERAVADKVAAPLGLGLQEAALGVVRVVNVGMEVALRLSLIERGMDHRRFALVAFGGAGPVHATRVARNVGIPTVIVPPYPGVSCAMGLLQTEVKHYYMTSRPGSLASIPLAELDAVFAGLEARAHEEAIAEGLDLADVGTSRQLDLRYPYQGYQLTVPCPPAPLTDEARQEVRVAFDRVHQQIYGTSAPDEIPEVVDVRVVSTSRVPTMRLAEVAAAAADAPLERALGGYRPVRFEESPTPVDTPVYRREALLAGHVIGGPAIVEQADATTVILPRQRAEVDRHGLLVITVEA